MARPKSATVASRDAEVWARWNSGERSLVTLAKDYDVTPQRLGQVIAAKEREVYTAWRTGRHTLADLAEIYELSAEDVTRIITVRHPEQKDEESGRAVLRSRIELLMIAIQEVIENPGYKLAPNGRLAEDDEGNPLVDIGARIEAMKLQLTAYERASRLDGSDKPQKSHVTVDVARQQADAFLADLAAKRDAERREMEALRRQVAVIPGEVMAELPPGA